MLAPQDPPTNAGESSDALVQSSTSSRAPQVADHQIDDAAIYTSSSVMTSSSPQFIGDPVHAADSPPRTPSTIRYAQVQSLENSPSVSHPHAYTPPINHPHASLPTTTHASSYVPPPSPEQSHGNTYQVPSSYYGKMDFQQGDGTSGQYQQQYAYQQNLHYQQQQQHAYPEPELVDTIDEKVKPSEPVANPVTTTNGRRKRIIWIGALVILVLIGAIVGLVIATKNKSSDNNNDLLLIPSTTPSTNPTRTAPIPSPRPGTAPTSSIPVTVSTSSIPVTVPTPGSGGGGGGSITPPPLPSLPPQCGTIFCNDYYRNCRFTVCAEDSDYKACVNKCGGPMQWGSEMK
ncbi:hypothetical protein BGX24_000553 [Mortierella sp. AD032]|nr:hypothetical protein BGX24_000553 [Mortierella sp. AD032]